MKSCVPTVYQFKKSLGMKKKFQKFQVIAVYDGYGLWSMASLCRCVFLLFLPLADNTRAQWRIVTMMAWVLDWYLEQSGIEPLGRKVFS